MRHLISIFAAALTASCAAEPSAEWPVRTDSAGVTLVRHGPADLPLDWTFEPVLEIGETDGPAAFGRVMASGVGVDRAGRIHVLDVLNFRVTAYDGSGAPVRTIGRSGSGPGEFRFPSDLGVRADGASAIFDFDRRAFVRFDSAGDVMPEVPAPGPLMRRVAWTHTGIAGAYRFEGEGDTSTIRLLLRVPDDTAATTLAWIGEPPTRDVELECGAVGFRPLLGAGLVWSAREDRIAVAAGTAYAIEIFDGPRRTAIWSRAIPSLPGTATLAAAELGGDSLRLPGGCRVGVLDAAEAIGYQDAAALVADIAVAPDGGVWVSRRLADGARAIDVWTPDGGYTGTLPAGSPFPAAFRGTDEMVTVERDALGVVAIRVWRIRKTA